MKTRCILSCSPLSSWGHVIYNGAYIWKWKLCLHPQHLENKTTIKRYRYLLIFIPRNIWEKAGELNFDYHKSYLSKLKLYAASRESKMELLIATSFRLWGELYRHWKYSKVFLWSPWNVLMRMHKRKKGKKTMHSEHPQV